METKDPITWAGGGLNKHSQHFNTMCVLIARDPGRHVNVYTVASLVSWGVMVT